MGYKGWKKMNTIKPTVIINDKVIIGDHNFIDDNCILGSIPCHTPIYNHMNLYGAKIGDGNSLYTGTYVVSGTTRKTLIFDSCIIGPMCIIGHDSIIRDRVEIMNGCRINGFVDVGMDTFIGSGATIRNRINIGFNCFIGQGSNVVADIPDNSFGFGNPFKVVKKTDGDFRLILKRIRAII